MRQIFQAVVDIIRGGVHPREVALAVCLGLLAGFLSGWNLCLAAVLLLVLLLNVPLKVFGEAWLLGTAVSWTFTPASFYVGRWLLEKSPWGTLLAPMREQPWLVLCDLDRYTLSGGAVLGVLLAIPAALIAAKATRYLQGQFNLLQAAWQTKTTWQAGLAVRLGCWLIFGDASKPQPVAVESRLWRPKGLLLCLGVVLPASGLVWYFAPGLIEQGVLTALSTANQSEVNAGDVRLSLSEGVLEISDLQISDPAHPDRDRLRVGMVAARLRPGPLLRGRVHVERLLLEDIAADVARQTRARPYGFALPNFEGIADFDLGRPTLPEGGPSAVNLDEYLGNWEHLQERLARLQELLRKVEALSQLHGKRSNEDTPAPAGPPASYVEMRRRRYDFGHRQPEVLVGLIAVKGFAPEMGLGGQGTLEITNLSSDPPLTGQPTRLAIKAPQLSTEILAQLNLHEPQARHELRFQALDIGLADLVHPRASRPALAIQGGSINLLGSGWTDAQEFELDLRLELRNFELQVVGERRLAGLPPEIWNQGLRQLNHLHTDAVVYGNWTSPRLKIDTERLVSQYKQQLLAAGEHLLAKAIDEQIARGEALLQETIDRNVAKVEQTIDRNVAKVEQTIDHNVAKVEQSAERLTAQAESAVEQGTQRLADAQGRIEQSTQGVQSAVQSSVNSSVQQGQTQIAEAGQRLQDSAAQLGGALIPNSTQVPGAGRLLGGNFGAVQALVSPGPAVEAGPGGALSAEPSAPVENPTRHGPPNIYIGAAPGTAGPVAGDPVAANPLPQQTPEMAPPNVAAGAAIDAFAPAEQVVNQASQAAAAGLRYPESLQAQPPQGEPGPPQQPYVASRNGPPNYIPPTNGYRPEQPAVGGYDSRPAHDRLPATEAARSPTIHLNQPANLAAPPARGLELGYDVPDPALSPRSAFPEMAALPASPAPAMGPIAPRDSGLASRNSASSVYPNGAPAENPSKIGAWTRNVGGRLKSMVPWGKGNAEDAEVTASDEPNARQGSAGALQRDPAPAASEEVATPWYRRVWR